MGKPYETIAEEKKRRLEEEIRKAEEDFRAQVVPDRFSRPLALGSFRAETLRVNGLRAEARREQEARRVSEDTSGS